MRKSTGLRFFKPWIEIKLYKIIFILDFNIGARFFIGVVIQNDQQTHRGVVVYEILNSDRLVHIQTLGDIWETATSFKVFEHRGEHLMLVGNHYVPGTPSPPNVSSKLYTWRENTSMFVYSEEIRVFGVKDVDYARFGNNSAFLALARHDDILSYDVPTNIYRYLPHHEKFVHFYNLGTSGATRVNFFTFKSSLYLFVAEEYAVSKSPLTNSSVYRWNSTEFVLVQEIETVGASDLLPFSVGDNFFVVAVNNQHNFSFNVQSKVYLMIDGVFKLFASLDTQGATKAEFFQIGLESFLVFSNSHDDFNNPIIHSVIYRLEGARFVCFQNILTRNAMYVRFFRLQNGCPVLAIANKGGKSVLYKWKSLSYTLPEGDC